MLNLKVENAFFDRVFCISVLEHIANPVVQQQGIREMVRILKPGGRLIITVDLGINSVLTSPLDVVKFSGLVPLGHFNLRWPEKRFVRYGDNAMDVFGIVLEKPNSYIFLDYDQQKSISSSEAYQKFVKVAANFSLPYSSIMLAKEYKSSLGPLKVFVKNLLGKYKD
jgi:ubiquinone/menaquinone biosynthesis C-methylase UbiE